jgi:hypothetical protein
VAAAYARGLGGALAVIGTIGLMMFGYLQFLGERMDNTAHGIALVMGGMLAAGLAVAVPSYWLGSRVSARDRAIRLTCGRLLGVALDPACVQRETAASIIECVDQYLQQRGAPDLDTILQRPMDHVRILDQVLLWVRAQMQVQGPTELHEQVTDRLLQSLAWSKSDLPSPRQ